MFSVNHVLNRVRQHTKGCTIIVSYMTGVTVAEACVILTSVLYPGGGEVVVMGKK